MRVLLFANNRIGVEVATTIGMAGDQIVALVLHEEQRRKCGPELMEAAQVPTHSIFTAAQLENREVLDSIRLLQPEIGVSALFGHKLKPPALTLPSLGCINLHPSYLPYNRGAYPNVWSIVDGTPAGATLHYMDERIDTGDIIAQLRVPVEIFDTGGSLYAKLEAASIALFREQWPRLRSGQISRQPQNGTGTQHLTRDVNAIDEIDLDADYRAGALIDVLRARTFPPYRGAFFLQNGRRVYLELTLRPGEDEKSSCQS